MDKLMTCATWTVVSVDNLLLVYHRGHMRKYLMFRNYISDISIPKHILRIIYELKKRAMVDQNPN